MASNCGSHTALGESGGRRFPNTTPHRSTGPYQARSARWSAPPTEGRSPRQPFAESAGPAGVPLTARLHARATSLLGPCQARSARWFALLIEGRSPRERRPHNSCSPRRRVPMPPPNPDEGPANALTPAHRLTRVFNPYRLQDNTRTWIITETDRCMTTLLFPAKIKGSVNHATTRARRVGPPDSNSRCRCPPVCAWSSDAGYDRR